MRRLLFLISLLGSSTGVAQLPTFLPGGRLRVDAIGTHRIDGTFESQTPDTLTLGVGAVRVVVPSASIKNIWVREARSRTQGAKRGMMRGAWAGPVVGLLASFVEGWSLFLPVTAVYSALGAAGGAVYGASTGTERWHNVYSNPTRAP